MSVTKVLAGPVVKTVAAATDRLRPPRRGVVVLLYHRVGRRTGSSVDLPLDLFVEQMEMLAESGRVLSLSQALVAVAAEPPEAAPDQREPLRRGARDGIVITFDDGTADFVDLAVPVLKRYSLPVTIYVATDFVERGVPFPRGEQPASWAALNDAQSTGFVTVGSHTHTHRLLDRVGPAEARDEIDRSCDLIGERLGTRAADFAYPKALPSAPAVEDLVRRRFRSAALDGTRANPVGATDPHRLARSPIQIGDGMRWFRHKVEGGMGLEDRLRRVANRRRYADLTQ